MKSTKNLLLILAIFTLIFASCKDNDDDDDDDTTTTAEELLATHLTDEGMDLGNIIMYYDESDVAYKFVVAPPADSASVQAFVDKYYIMDLRASDAYAISHIEGAVNVAFTDILTESANAGDKQILLVCYTGQTACYGTALLRLYGFPKTQSLKWGMSGWNSTLTAKWDDGVGNVADGHDNWTYDAAPSNVTYDPASVSSTSTDGASILLAQVEDVVSESFMGLTADAVITTPTDYFIGNYFSSTDYSGFGHIDGSYQTTSLLLSDESLLNLDPDKQVVVYCYTGQTSAVITAYLRVLGYDAYSLKFGMNGLYNSNSAWVSNKWDTSADPYDLPVVQ